jgi:hypothetical protein
LGNFETFEMDQYYKLFPDLVEKIHEIKQGSFIQQTQYFIPVEIDLSVVPARLGISDFFTCPIGQIFL